MKLPTLPKRLTKVLIILIIALAASIPSIYFYSQYQKTQKLLQDPSLYAKEEQDKLVARVGKLIELPADEQPTIAIIADREKLKDQPLFGNAKNGDKVLIYLKARKAILYDPAANKIVDVGPVNISSPTATINQNNLTEKYKIVLYNGTDTVGLTRKYEEELKSKIKNFEVVDRNNAKSRNYDKTILIDISGNKKDQVEALSKILGIALSNLPEGETAAASADFLIIVGADKK